MIIRPQRNFTIVRQIANHTDTATYYVQAVIRDAYTDDIIDTLQLTDKGGQRFTKNWQVVADPLGLGREISIVTSVYSDSGYTTKSENYGDEENTYLIEENRALVRGGGGGIDSRTVKRIFKEEIEGFAKKYFDTLEESFETIKDKIEEITAKKSIKEIENTNTILNNLVKLRDIVAEIPKQKTNLAPIEKGLEAVIQAIKKKEVTPPTDLSELSNFLADFKASQQQYNGDFTEIRNDIADSHEKIFDVVTTLKENLVKEINTATTEAIKKTNFVTSFITHPAELSSKNKPEKEEEDENPLIDIEKLTR